VSCASAASPSETTECSDEIDNDGDGFVDWWGEDPECFGLPHVRSESPHAPCGLGAELALLVPALQWLRARRRAAPRA
jgi:hypothetical protein